MDITDLRKEIDQIDDQLLRLFAQRMDVSLRIADYKKQQNLPIYVPSREREKLMDVGTKAGPALSSHARVLYSLLFELSRSYQSEHNGNRPELFLQIADAIECTPKLFPQQVVVACQSCEDEAMVMACHRIFRDSCPLFFSSLDAVFSAVEQGMCHYGIVPLEDDASSSVKSVYDRLIDRGFFIVRSFRLQNQSGSPTRYICISKALEIYPGADRSSIMMVVPHQPGALYRVLARLSVLGINITRLESRPMENRDFDFRFYFDLETSIYSGEFLHLMCELEDLCKEFHYLGSYTEVI